MADSRTAPGAVQTGGDMVEELPYRSLSGLTLFMSCALTVVSVVIVLNQLLNLHLFSGIVFVENRYLFILAATILPIVFLAYPARTGRAQAPLPALDVAFALIALAAGLYFAWNSQRILNEGWEYGAPTAAVWISGIYCVLIVEALRRTGGMILTVIVLLFALYPVFADKMPGPIAGLPQSFGDTIAYHIVSAESAFGIPMKAFGEIVVGFIVFGVALNYTGGGNFFNDLAFALVGALPRRRGAGRRSSSSGAAGLDQRQRDLERDLLGRRHDPGDEAHRLFRDLCRRRRGGRVDRRAC